MDKKTNESKWLPKKEWYCNKQRERLERFLGSAQYVAASWESCLDHLGFLVGPSADHNCIELKTEEAYKKAIQRLTSAFRLRR